MGQSLVLRVDSNGKQVASVYFHWSGFTFDSVDEINKILDYFKNNNVKLNTDSDVRMGILKAIVDNKGSMASDEIEFARKLLESDDKNEIDFLLNVKPNRDNGIVCFSKYGMEKLEDAAEMFSDILINNGEVLVKPDIVIVSEEEFNKFYKKTKEKVRECPENIKNIMNKVPFPFTVEEFKEYYSFLNNEDKYAFFKFDNKYFIL